MKPADPNSKSQQLRLSLARAAQGGQLPFGEAARLAKEFGVSRQLVAQVKPGLDLVSAPRTRQAKARKRVPCYQCLCGQVSTRKELCAGQSMRRVRASASGLPGWPRSKPRRRSSPPNSAPRRRRVDLSLEQSEWCQSIEEGYDLDQRERTIGWTAPNLPRWIARSLADPTFLLRGFLPVSMT